MLFLTPPRASLFSVNRPTGRVSVGFVGPSAPHLPPQLVRSRRRRDAGPPSTTSWWAAAAAVLLRALCDHHIDTALAAAPPVSPAVAPFPDGGVPPPGPRGRERPGPARPHARRLRGRPVHARARYKAPTPPLVRVRSVMWHLPLGSHRQRALARNRPTSPSHRASFYSGAGRLTLWPGDHCGCGCPAVFADRVVVGHGSRLAHKTGTDEGEVLPFIVKLEREWLIQKEQLRVRMHSQVGNSLQRRG